MNGLIFLGGVDHLGEMAKDQLEGEAIKLYKPFSSKQDRGFLSLGGLDYHQSPNSSWMFLFWSQRGRMNRDEK